MKRHPSEPRPWRIPRVFQAAISLLLFPVAASAQAPCEPVRWQEGARVAHGVRCGDQLSLDRADVTVLRQAIVELRVTSDAASTLAALELVPVETLSFRRPLYLVESTRPGEDGLDVAVRLAPRVAAGDLVLASPDLGVMHRAAAIDVPPDDPRFGAQWYLDRIGILDAWTLSTGDAATTISVVDDGCDLLHEDLMPRMLPGADVFDGDDDPSFLPSSAGNAHGTACAGIAAAAGDNGLGIAGACPECSLRCVRLLGPSGTAIPISADVRAFELAIEWGVSVVSNSWGFVEPITAPAPLATAIEAVFTEGRGGLGALVVFAAGNDDREIFDYEIEALRGVVTVGAIRSRDEATSFSNHGAALDLVAPTGTVTADITGPDGNEAGDYTALFGGTSSAAPVVSGVAALLFSAVPEATAEEVHDALLAGVRPAPYAMPDAMGHDPLYGYGVVDPAGSLRILLAAHGRLDAGVDPDAGAENDGGVGVDAGPAPPPSSRCGCRVGHTRPAASLWLVSLVIACLVARKRPDRRGCLGSVSRSPSSSSAARRTSSLAR